MFGELTRRRVQDCCATLHNCMLKWKHLTETSFDLLSVKIFNTVNCTDTSQSVASQDGSSGIGVGSNKPHDVEDQVLQEIMEEMV